jgi:hypothetical protein
MKKMNCLTVQFIKNSCMSSIGERIMSKTQFLFRRDAHSIGLGVSILCVCVFLGAAAPSARAQAGIFVANAIKNAIVHKISGNHNSNSFNSPLDSNKMMVVLPEPGSPSLMALGGVVGLAAWWLRRRSTRKSTS